MHYMDTMELGRETTSKRTRTGIKTATMARGRRSALVNSPEQNGHGKSAPYGEMSITAGNGKKLKLLTREALDGRCQAARFWDAMIADIENDLGGHAELSMIEQTLVQAYVSAALTLQNLNTRLLLGEEIDFSQHSQCVSAMTRVASRLGIRRRAKQIPGLHDSGGLLDQMERNGDAT